MVWPSGFDLATYSVDVARSARLVLDDDGAPGDRPQLLGKIAHEHVGAAARRESANQADVLARVLLRPCLVGATQSRGQRQRAGGENLGLSQHLHVSPPLAARSMAR